MSTPNKHFAFVRIIWQNKIVEKLAPVSLVMKIQNSNLNKSFSYYMNFSGLPRAVSPGYAESVLYEDDNESVYTTNSRPRPLKQGKNRGIFI